MLEVGVHEDLGEVVAFIQDSFLGGEVFLFGVMMRGNRQTRKFSPERSSRYLSSGV